MLAVLAQPDRAGVWRNSSASDSRSEGWEFKSLCPHACPPRALNCSPGLVPREARYPKEKPKPSWLGVQTTPLLPGRFFSDRVPRPPPPPLLPWAGAAAPRGRGGGQPKLQTSPLTAVPASSLPAWFFPVFGFALGRAAAWRPWHPSVKTRAPETGPDGKPISCEVLWCVPGVFRRRPVPGPSVAQFPGGPGWICSMSLFALDGFGCKLFC